MDISSVSYKSKSNKVVYIKIFLSCKTSINLQSVHPRRFGSWQFSISSLVMSLQTFSLSSNINVVPHWSSVAVPFTHLKNLPQPRGSGNSPYKRGHSLLPLGLSGIGLISHININKFFLSKTDLITILVIGL